MGHVRWKWEETVIENREFSKGRGQFDPKFKELGVVPHQPFFLSENWMNGSYTWCKYFGSRLFRVVTIHAFDGRTDRHTDRKATQFYYTTRKHSQSHGKNAAAAAPPPTRLRFDFLYAHKHNRH